MGIFRRNQNKLDPEIRALVASHCKNLMSHVGKSLRCYSESINQDLFKARESLREALSELEDQRICLESMKELWPQGQPVFDQIKQGIDAQYGLIINAEEITSLINNPLFDIRNLDDAKKYRDHMSKNRNLAIEAGHRFDKANKILKKKTGLELTMTED